MRGHVVRLVLEDDVPVAVERHAVLGVRQVLGGQPEVERVLRHQLERESRRDRRRARRERDAVELADEGDVAHRVVPLLRREVEVVDAERLLEDGRVRALRDREQDRVDVAHVVPADDVRAVGEAARVPVVRRAQQQRRRVDRAAATTTTTSAEYSSGTPLRSTETFVTTRPVRVGVELRDLRAGQQRHVRVGQRRLDAADVGVGLWPARGTGTRRRSRSGCTSKRPRSSSFSMMPSGTWKGCRPLLREVVREVLDARLVARRPGRDRGRTPAAPSGPRRGCRGRGRASRLSGTRAPSRRRRSATPAKRRRGAGSRRSPPGAGGRARRRRTWCCPRRSSWCADGAPCRPCRARLSFVGYLPSTLTAFELQLSFSRGTKSPRSRTRILLPVARATRAASRRRRPCR